MKSRSLAALFAAFLLLQGPTNSVAQVAPAAAGVPRYEGLGGFSRKVTASPEAQAYFNQGLSFLYAFNHDEAIRSFQRASELDPKSAMPLWGLALANGDYATAEPYLNESLRLAREMGDRKAEARALAGLGVATMYQGRLGDALSIGEDSLALYEQLGEMRGVAMSHHNLGSIEHMLGRPERAADHFTAALTLLSASGDIATETLCRAALAASWLRLGEHARALAELRSCSELLLGLHSVRETVYVLTVLAELLQMKGRPADSARLLGASETLRTTAGMKLLPGEQTEVDMLLGRLATELGPDAVDSSVRAGALLSSDQSLAEVKTLLNSVKLD